MQRDSYLQKIRPEISQTKYSAKSGEEELFQNEVLRPVIKFQNELLIEAFKNYIRKHKNAFFELSVEKRLEYIERAIQKDMKFRNSLKGMILGQFLIEEYKSYINNSSALNKRMMQLVIQRLQSNIQLLENEVVG